MTKSKTPWFNYPVNEQTAVLWCSISFIASGMLLIGLTEQGFQTVSNGIFAVQLQASILMQSALGSF